MMPLSLRTKPSVTALTQRKSRARTLPVSLSVSRNLCTSPSGLQWKDLKEGQGPEPSLRQSIRCKYIGRFPDGRVFDSSKGVGPFSFTIGVGMVIKGWDLGILGSKTEGIPPMREGGKRLMVVPPDLAYGQKGFGEVIPPNATLEFEVELLKKPGAIGEAMSELWRLWGELRSGV